MPCTLTHDAYVRLKRFGDPVRYPMNTLGVAFELQDRGYTTSVPVLNYMIKLGIVKPHRVGRNYAWRPCDVETVAKHLGETGEYNSEACMLLNLKVDAAQFYEALEEAQRDVYETFRIKPGRERFVMHVRPANFGHAARVEFELPDEVRRAWMVSSASPTH